MTGDNPRVEVVVGVVIRGGRLLLTQRPQGKEFGMLWECPGGKRRPDEPRARALARELREELGVEEDSVRVGGFITGRQFDPPVVRAACSLYFYAAEFPGEPRAAEGQPGIGWFDLEDVACLRMTPGNEAVRRVLLRALLER